MKFVETDITKETQAVLTYDTQNLRILHSEATQMLLDEPVQESINYDQSIDLKYKHAVLFKYALNDLRFNWTLLKIFNQNLSEAVSFINMEVQDYNFDNIWLSVSIYLSVLRELWMTPIKIEL